MTVRVKSLKKRGILNTPSIDSDKITRNLLNGYVASAGSGHVTELNAQHCSATSEK